MDSLGGYIAMIAVSLIIGYLSKFLEPRSKVVWWSPHNFTFQLKQPAVTLVANSLTIQNTGRLPAENVEVIYQSRPDFFQFTPAVPFEETTTSNGEHVITLRSLGPREWVFLQLLSYQTLPQLQNVRWKGGQANWIPIQPQRVLPRWLLVVGQILLVIGGATLVYWIIYAGTFVFRHTTTGR